MTLRLQVNGRVCEVRVSPLERLSRVLRDELALTGTKIGCHAGDCGACTILLGDEPACACLLAAGRCEGSAITTVEGLAGNATLTRLQQAFVAHGAAQCGICTPGMLMSAAALLRRVTQPSESQVLDAIGGVLCRCTGYRKIVEAVLAAAGSEPLTTVQPAAGQAVGARVARLDADAKVRGTEAFGADALPADFVQRGGLHLRVIRSPYAHARIELGDLAAFQRQHPAVAAVLTAADVPNNAFAIFAHLRDQPVLADGEARFAGEAVLLLAGDEGIFDIADAALPLHFTPLPAAHTMQDSLAPGAPRVQARYPDNILCRGNLEKGQVEAGLARAPLRVSGEFSTRYVEHAYIEPEAGTAELIGAPGQAPRIRIWACTQTPYMDRDEVAHVLGWAPEQVHIQPSAIGGGFGGKLDLSVQPLLAIAALKLKRPVRLVYERGESMRSSTKRHPAQMHAALACDAQGRLAAFDFAGDFNTGAYASWGPTVANRVPIHACGPYRVPNVRARTRAVLTHDSVAGAFRGFGVPQSTLLGEALMDELAAKAGIDSLEFRHLNALRAGDATCTGQVLAASVGLRACLEALRPAWREGLQSVAKHNATNALHKRGIGIACMWYGIGNTVIANPSTMRGALRLNAQGVADLMLYNGAQEIGQGTATVMPQMFADAVGLPLRHVQQLMGDTDATPDAGKSSASRQTFVSGNAARLAGESLRAQLLQALGMPEPAALELQGHELVCGPLRLDLRNLPVDADGNLFTGEGTFNPPTVPLDESGQGVPYATYGFAAQVAEVEVDVPLGTVKLLHIHAAHDVGRAIHPTLTEGQIHGGIAQGIGMALMEEYVNGRTDNLHDYLIPTAGDVPPITVHLIEDPEPLGPWGAKGVGEPALVATAPAILAAIRQATGAKLMEVPVTPARLHAALKAREEAP